MESVIDKAQYPLTLNKLEGDAAFLFSEIQQDSSAQALSALHQTLSFFEAFNNKLSDLSLTAATCSCDACENLGILKLKAILHIGEVAFKKIRTFEELAGEPVIIVHRLLKNSLKSSEYVIITKHFHDSMNQEIITEFNHHSESYPDLGDIEVLVHYPVPRAPSQPVGFNQYQLSSYTKLKTNTIRNVSLLLRFTGLKQPRLTFKLKHSKHL